MVWMVGERALKWRDTKKGCEITRFGGFPGSSVGYGDFAFHFAQEKKSYRCLFTSGIRKLLNAVSIPLFTRLQERPGCFHVLRARG